MADITHVTRKTAAREIEGEVRQIGIQSVEIAGTVLAALMKMSGPCRLSDLARTVNMPNAKLHRYMVSLVRTGLATREATSGLYDLGPAALQLGLLGFSRFDLLRFAERSLAEIVAATGESAMLATWSSRGPFIVRLAEARHEFAGSVPNGHACPLTHSATGLVFASFGDPAEILPLLHTELQQNKRSGRPGAPTTEADFEASVARTRREGIGAIADGGPQGTSAVSAPVFDGTGHLTLALTVFGRQGRLDISHNGRLATLVRSAAAELSRSLGLSDASATKP